VAPSSIAAGGGTLSVLDFEDWEICKTFKWRSVGAVASTSWCHADIVRCLSSHRNSDSFLFVCVSKKYLQILLTVSLLISIMVLSMLYLKLIFLGLIAFHILFQYWVSQGNKWCDLCKIFISNNPFSIRTHEIGKRHKDNVTQRLSTMKKDGAAKEKELQQAAKALQLIEAVSLKFSVFIGIAIHQSSAFNISCAQKL
jgi:hypothetical protein